MPVARRAKSQGRVRSGGGWCFIELINAPRP